MVATNSGDSYNFFETGYILIGNKRFDVEEISVNASRDLTPYHIAAQRDPISLRPGKNKIEFTMKRAFSDAILAKMYDECCIFAMLLINNDDPEKPQSIMMLEGCRLTQDNIGPINGSDVVTEDLQGTAIKRTWETCSIAQTIDNVCDFGCPKNVGTQLSGDEASILTYSEGQERGANNNVDWLAPWETAYETGSRPRSTTPRRA